MTQIQNIILNNFRNHKHLKIKLNNDPVTLITGKNGAGKTNLLEAISLISPGKGIKSSNFSDMEYNFLGKWEIESLIENNSLLNYIKINWDGEKRSIQLNQKTCKNFGDISSLIRIVWLTPQMNNLLNSGPQKKRQFFDRITHSFYSDHAENISKYNKMKLERMRFLKSSNTSYIGSIENFMSLYGMKITESRIKAMKILNESENLQRKFEIKVLGKFEKLLKSETDKPHAKINEAFRHNRKQDLISERTLLGPHLSNFQVTDLENKTNAENCSTGEQKLILISIIMSARNKNTLILLDDILAHLDELNRDTLIKNITSNGYKVWITDTEIKHYLKYPNISHRDI